MLGADDDIGCNARIQVFSVATLDYVADVLDRALLENAPATKWKESGSVLISRLRFESSVPELDVSHEEPFLSPIPLPFVR